jgi:hypothetical protein
MPSLRNETEDCAAARARYERGDHFVICLPPSGRGSRWSLESWCRPPGGPGRNLYIPREVGAARAGRLAGRSFLF